MNQSLNFIQLNLNLSIINPQNIPSGDEQQQPQPLTTTATEIKRNIS